MIPNEFANRSAADSPLSNSSTKSSNSTRNGDNFTSSLAICERTSIASTWKSPASRSDSDEKIAGFVAA